MAIDANLPVMEKQKKNNFFNPLWRRVLVLVFVAGWVGYEIIVTRESLWIMLSLGMLAYGFWTFILQWPKEGEPTKPGS